MADRSDDFNRASIGSGWTTVSWWSAMQILSSQFGQGSAAVANNGAYWNEAVNWKDGASDADLHVTVAVYKTGSPAGGVGAVVWKSTGAYVLEWYDGGPHLSRVTSADSWTELDTAADTVAINDGDTLELQITAGTVYGIQQGTTYKTASNTTYRDSLKPGMYSYYNSTSYLCVNAWEATGLEAAGVNISITPQTMVAEIMP